MGDMQAQGLDYGFSLLKIHHKVFVNVLSQKLFRVNELLNVLQRFCNFFFAVGSIQRLMNLCSHLCWKGHWLFQLRDLI